ncbi:MAG: hypothetical protein IH795_09380 [Bacteroidetes bacterium]|nr:hypothetical protein [Bacteroidota bacterium]
MALQVNYTAKKMEKDFYEQLSRAYTKKGDHKKANEFMKKASEMKLQN